jgi:hypothetical protein
VNSSPGVWRLSRDWVKTATLAPSGVRALTKERKASVSQLNVLFIGVMMGRAFEKKLWDKKMNCLWYI